MPRLPATIWPEMIFGFNSHSLHQLRGGLGRLEILRRHGLTPYRVQFPALAFMKWTPANITEDLRQMGRDDFAQGQPQSYGLRCWCENSLALKRWLEGWEQAELEAYCDEMAWKDKWLVGNSNGS